MTGKGTKKETRILARDDLKALQEGGGLKIVRGITRRDFIKYSVVTAAGIYLSTAFAGCGGGQAVAAYPISSTVVDTTGRVLSFTVPPMPSGPNSGTGLYPTELPLISQYAKYGYGKYTWGGGLQIAQRTDIMPIGYSNKAPVRLKQFANFFAISDIHITDKEAPNQLIYLQQEDPVYGAPGLSLYTPILLYTTHLLDAAIQTANALHKKTPFDFGISLGDTCDSTRYNELRWYIDVIDGKVITPSSGAHLGAGKVDYQTPFQAAGLDKSIPWYQVIGNHDHFYLGSFPVDADPSLYLRQSYLSDNVWAVGDVIRPNSPATFPCIYDTTASLKAGSFYMGVLDGSTPYGNIIDAGSVGSINPPPTVAADPDRRSLLKSEWIQEFFNTTTTPSGHGFNLVDPSMGSGFACYSFVPNPGIPLKVIVLDDTQSETDGSLDIHGHGFLDATRWNWLQSELAAGQANNQLMIIAAHVPIAVASIGSEVEWWESGKDPNATEQNACSLTELVAALQSAPNLIMWMSGHRHLNTVKAFISPDPNSPEMGFWQVETASLRNFPQQFRTFRIYLNSDYTVSIVTVNVDPAVAEGTPAATSLSYGIAAQQITQGNQTPNTPNVLTAYGISVDTMDPTRPQDGTDDPTIIYGAVPGVPCCASYNAELFKQLSPQMIAALQAVFPNT